MRVLSVGLTIALAPALLSQTAIAQAQTGSLISSPFSRSADLYRSRGNEFFLQGQQRLEAEAEQLRQPRPESVQSGSLLRVRPELSRRDDRGLPCLSSGRTVDRDSAQYCAPDLR
jgi:hypothetical protein